MVFVLFDLQNFSLVLKKTLWFSDNIRSVLMAPVDLRPGSHREKSGVGSHNLNLLSSAILATHYDAPRAVRPGLDCMTSCFLETPRKREEARTLAR